MRQKKINHGLKTRLVLTSAASLFLLAQCGSMRQAWPNGNAQQVKISFPDSTVLFEVANHAGLEPLEPSLTYYAFDGKEISKSSVLVDRRVLNGSYIVLDENDQFLVKGQFDSGLKSGQWVRQRSTQLTKHTYLRGHLEGEYEIFEGLELREQGEYHDGEKHGKVKFYRSDTIFMALNFNRGEVKDTL